MPKTEVGLCMKRRQFMKSSALGLSAFSLPGSAILSSPAVHAKSLRDPFWRAFVVPPLDTGKRDGKQVHFDLSIAHGERNFVADLITPTLGINGTYMGPVLRAQRGDHVSFAVKNQLHEATTLHWHGFVLPAAMDGGPHQEIRPGETWRPEFEIIQPAASYWYHSHQHKKTGEQVYHGLAGMFIIDDEISLNAGLPMDYGVDDLPIVIQDRAFNRDGSLRYLASMHDRMHGMQGSTILVNGVITPGLKAQSSLLRLRLLNASNARFYNLAFDDARLFVVIAGDGGFLPRPVKAQTLSLAPGERAEILVDLSDGRDTILVNRPGIAPANGGTMNQMMGMMGGGNEAFNIMQIEAPSSGRRTRIDIPQEMLPLPEWQAVKPVKTRQFQLQMQMGPRMMMSNMMGKSPFSISGESMDMKVINHRVKSNSIELWEISNSSMLAHPFHVHGTQFIILNKSRSEIKASETGLKDTVVVNSQETVRLLIPFSEYSDSTRPYMYHCHILEHEDAGMMGQFSVV